MSTEELAPPAPDRLGSVDQQVAAGERSAAPAEVSATLVIEELLVEEISIDGMCGVY